jgi:hypothetical protein
MAQSPSLGHACPLLMESQSSLSRSQYSLTGICPELDESSQKNCSAGYCRPKVFEL